MGCIGSRPADNPTDAPVETLDVQQSEQTKSDNQSLTPPFGNDILDLTNAHSAQSETATSSNLNLTYVESKSPRQSLLRGKERRVIFISLHHLNQSYKAIPPNILNKSIFCFGAREEWLLPKTKAERDASEKSYLGNKRIDDQLKTIVGDKNAQGLVIWVEPQQGSYQEVSECLIRIDDPATSNKFNPLILDHEWWQNVFGTEGHKSRYHVTGDDVVTEIESVKFKYLPIMELLYQSNPSLIPMKGFDPAKLAASANSPSAELVVIDE